MVTIQQLVCIVIHNCSKKLPHGTFYMKVGKY